MFLLYYICKHFQLIHNEKGEDDESKDYWD